MRSLSFNLYSWHVSLFQLIILVYYMYLFSVFTLVPVFNLKVPLYLPTLTQIAYAGQSNTATSHTYLYCFQLFYCAWATNDVSIIIPVYCICMFSFSAVLPNVRYARIFALLPIVLFWRAYMTIIVQHII